MGKFKGKRAHVVPVKFDGFTVGKADISADGEVINIELDNSYVAHEIRDMLVFGFADGLSIRPNVTPAQEAKKSRWEQKTLPYGM